MKSIVGVMPLWDEKLESVWMLPGYLEAIQTFGAIPIIFPFTKDKEEIDELTSLCDGFLFTGGHDVNPKLYNEEAYKNVECCTKRDEMESYVLENAIKQDKPVLGICRGLQFINVFLGGSLYQDLDIFHPSKINHHQSPPYDEGAHSVSLIKETPLYNCLLQERIEVNSYHHQAIKQLSNDLEQMAVSIDGLVEAFFMPEKKFLWAVQWHPEFSYRKDENSQKIFKAFITSMKL